MPFNSTHQFHRLDTLMSLTEGNPSIRIAIIDGPIADDHLAISGNIKDQQHSNNRCIDTGSYACEHGTFITGMLGAKRSTSVPGICPSCSFIIEPILPERNVRVKADQLAKAIQNALSLGANIINLSLGMPLKQLSAYSSLTEAFDLAFQKGCLIIAAAGNEGRIGPSSLFQHPWVIPVVAANLQGDPLPNTNIPFAASKHGLMAVGEGIKGLSSKGAYTEMSGSSMSTALVSGTAALLWSLRPQSTAHELRTALLGPASSRKKLLPPLLNAANSWQKLQHN